MTHAVVERGQTLFLKSLEYGLHLRIKDNRHGLIDQMSGKDVLPTIYAFIWHCPETHQVWVEDDEGQVGVFDLMHCRWVVPLRFSKVIPCFDNPYRFKVSEGRRTGTYDYLKGVLEWQN